MRHIHSDKTKSAILYHYAINLSSPNSLPSFKPEALILFDTSCLEKPNAKTFEGHYIKQNHMILF